LICRAFATARHRYCAARVRKIAAQVTLRARFFRSIGAAKKAWDKS
jgi:hypothetical protein